MNEIPTLLLASLAILVCLAAFFIVLDIFFPVRIGRTQTLIDQSPGRAFLVGLVNATFVSVLLLVLNSLHEQSGAGIFQLLMVILLGAAAICVIFGLAGIVCKVGMRLRPASSALVQVIWGSTALGLACALPFVGWFILLPFACVLGLGAAVLSFFTPRTVVSSEETAREATD
jgi:hypothetical protein